MAKNTNLPFSLWKRENRKCTWNSDNIFTRLIVYGWYNWIFLVSASSHKFVKKTVYLLCGGVTLNQPAFGTCKHKTIILFNLYNAISWCQRQVITSLYVCVLVCIILLLLGALHSCIWSSIIASFFFSLPHSNAFYVVAGEISWLI